MGGVVLSLKVGKFHVRVWDKVGDLSDVVWR